MASVRDIAKRAGVSTATVSRVLNNHPRVSDEARQKVLMVANESRYVPTVGRRSTGNVAYVYTDVTTLDSPYDASIIQGIFETLEQHELDLMVLNARQARQTGETLTQLFMRKGVSGVVVRTTESTRHYCESLADEGFPAVVVGDRFEGEHVRYVDYESRDASREAVEHLIELGHTRIALATNVVEDTDHRDRIEGYKQALSDAGLTIDPRLVIQTPAHLEGGSQLIRRIMTMADRPTAIFITDPFTSLGAMNEARAMGLDIPRHLSLIGFDDAELRSSIYPKMSAVCQDAKRLGKVSLELLSDLVNSPANIRDTAPVGQSLRAWFEVNGTTAAVPAA
ncbi:LacI family DNA-binding transcriptional regulator [Mucisphaera calidilacus]|uniref:HTH-type transcriptional regulator DegA n=1 Tax=Mucisphaera calidilacus TaxID=2527982 RepID=A0A518BY47_9BACT|nr:LacI family DNA-binding transcriptional regulator [Mucisphaera calidilacus]QDU71876.1 HTH-type transcriptional regulator DegA [Mucisphaera calidilacus]